MPPLLHPVAGKWNSIHSSIAPWWSSFVNFSCQFRPFLTNSLQYHHYILSDFGKNFFQQRKQQSANFPSMTINLANCFLNKYTCINFLFILHTCMCVRHIPTYKYNVRLKWSQQEFLVQKWVFCYLWLGLIIIIK